LHLDHISRTKHWKCLRLSGSLEHGEMVLLFVRYAPFLKRQAPSACLVSSSTGVGPLRFLRGSRVITTVIIISQEHLGAVKSTTARSRDLTAIKKLVLFKFPHHCPTLARLLVVARKTCVVGLLLCPYALHDYLETPTWDLSQTRASQRKQ
jgi:hypothetical protein